MLTLFEPFLTSSFYRSPPPALGPMAFQKFWKATFDGREEFHKPYPGIIDECLISLRANYGVNAVVGLSQSTDSQQTVSEPDFSRTTSLTKQISQVPSSLTQSRAAVIHAALVGSMMTKDYFQGLGTACHRRQAQQLSHFRPCWSGHPRHAHAVQQLYNTYKTIRVTPILVAYRAQRTAQGYKT